MSKTGYRQVYNIQDKLFYSEMKFQIIEFSVLAKYIANIQELKIINVNIILESKICTSFNR